MSESVEIRIQLDEQAFQVVKGVLRKEGRYRGRVKQVDHYLNNPDEPLYKDYLRVRKTSRKDYLFLKRLHKDPKTKEVLFDDSYEVMIKSAKDALDVFKALGYSEVSLVEKQRELYLIDIFEVSIDTVKGLGVFLKVELLYEVPDPEIGYQIIYEFLRLIGVKRFKEHPDSYISMLSDPKCDTSKEVQLG